MIKITINNTEPLYTNGLVSEAIKDACFLNKVDKVLKLTVEYVSLGRKKNFDAILKEDNNLNLLN